MKDATAQAIKDAGLWEAHEQIERIKQAHTERQPTKLQARAFAHADEIVALYRERRSVADVAWRIGVYAPLVREVLQSRGIELITRETNLSELADRNKEICRRVASGENMSSVGRAYNITGHRVKQIMEREHRRSRSLLDSKVPLT